MTEWQNAQNDFSWLQDRRVNPVFVSAFCEPNGQAIQKSGASGGRTVCGLGNPRYGRLGSLRYAGKARPRPPLKSAVRAGGSLSKGEKGEQGGGIARLGFVAGYAAPTGLLILCRCGVLQLCRPSGAGMPRRDAQKTPTRCWPEPRQGCHICSTPTTHNSIKPRPRKGVLDFVTLVFFGGTN